MVVDVMDNLAAEMFKIFGVLNIRLCNKHVVEIRLLKNFLHGLTVPIKAAFDKVLSRNTRIGEVIGIHRMPIFHGGFADVSLEPRLEEGFGFIFLESLSLTLQSFYAVSCALVLIILVALAAVEV